MARNNMIKQYHKILELYEEIPVLKSRYNFQFPRSNNPLDEDLSKITNYIINT